MNKVNWIPGLASIHYKSVPQDESYLNLPQRAPVSFVYSGDSAKSEKMPQKKPDLDWTELAKAVIESGESDMLGEVLKQKPDLDWTELAKAVIKSGESDMLGEVLKQKPDLDWTELAKAVIESGESDMLGEVFKQKLDHGASPRNTSIAEKLWLILLVLGVIVWFVENQSLFKGAVL